MSAVEMAVEKVKHMDEAQALQLLAWLRTRPGANERPRGAVGAIALLGFARRFRSKPRATAEWMAELRAGDIG
jgi:hypothetical protein